MTDRLSNILDMATAAQLATITHYQGGKKSWKL